jgi:hypothetical protein
MHWKESTVSKTTTPYQRAIINKSRFHESSQHTDLSVEGDRIDSDSAKTIQCQSLRMISLICQILETHIPKMGNRGPKETTPSL